jgi:hypothetical protein
VIWLANLRADVPNFRAAVDWSLATGRHELAVRLAGALGWFWTLEGMLDEASRHLIGRVSKGGPWRLVRRKRRGTASMSRHAMARLSWSPLPLPDH